ncbi:unnamed protein product [Brachionus calyciflorus]|uniref:Uncharacterized protein n=1 Tax=Brachionus calyciflorus TaxID=104777 RepID=A0A814IQJ9_9BILA|nr:unnamed protein product [Brachionus calyciflorus]
MIRNEFERNCIVVRWTQIFENELIDDPSSDLYFVDIEQIIEGNYITDKVVVCNIMVKEKLYNDCLCEVIDSSVKISDYRNLAMRV